ncbi:MAG: hypothetical protein LUD72_10385 [Bacteroidales bacterium]|nr:hypothetical protein [Bacteroidales bacterium]
MDKLVINGVELELNLMRASVMDKWEAAAAEVERKVKEVPEAEDISAGEKIRRQCAIIGDFFDDVFGDGTATSIFQHDDDLTERMEAYATTMTYGSRSAVNRTREIVSKYDPNRIQNRSQRRNQQYNNNPHGSKQQKGGYRS